MSSQPHTLITGGAGMIGSNLARRLVEAGHRVSVVDNLWRGRREYLVDQAGWPLIDMASDFHRRDLMIPGIMDDLLQGVDYVYHLADVVAGIGFVFAHQGFVFRQNLIINSNVIESVRRHPVRGFVYVGTACSFPQEKQSGVDAAPLREEDIYPAHPESAYGWSKLMGEYESFLMEQETGVPVSVLSLHNVYGPPCDFSEANSQVIPSLIRKALSWPEQPFSVWGSGAQGRAFVYTEDVVDALVATLDKGLGEGVIQVGPDVCTTIREVAETVVDISGKGIEIQYDTSKPEGDRGRCADYSKARRVLGWAPSTSLRDGLSATYDWIAARL